MSSTKMVRSEGPTKDQCHYFVLRKKRYCRMTVRPGRQYCGEHEPPPPDDQADKRVPCPNDSKHTVYISKLEKHLSICNARPGPVPAYIVPQVNTERADDHCPRVPLTQVPNETLLRVIEKINHLYEVNVKGNIETLPPRPIHPAVAGDYGERSRTHSSRRHLRQASRLLHLLQDEGLVQEGTCYVELGAGKGQLSYYMGVSWCAASSRLLPVDRAALRHKRERRDTRDTRDTRHTTSDINTHDTQTKVTETAHVKAPDDASKVVPKAVREGAVQRIRADLEHLALERVPHAEPCAHLVGLAKHLCGVATDYAIRCVSSCERARGLAVATCCHHRCAAPAYLGRAILQEQGISVEELNIMLSIVSWATCGDGRSRGSGGSGGSGAPGSTGTGRGSNEPEQGSNEPELNADKSQDANTSGFNDLNEQNELEPNAENSEPSGTTHTSYDPNSSNSTKSASFDTNVQDSVENNPEETDSRLKLSQEYREVVGRRAKALLDWGRVRWLRARGFSARLAYFVPTTDSLENLCIIAKRI